MGSQTGAVTFQLGVCLHQCTQQNNKTKIEATINCKNEPPIDFGAAFSSAVNEKTLHDLKTAEVTVKMMTNVGDAIPNEHGSVLDMKHKTWKNSRGPADSSDECHVCFNNPKEDAFAA